MSRSNKLQPYKNEKSFLIIFSFFVIGCGPMVVTIHSETARGSGFLVERGTLVTAAHNLPLSPLMYDDVRVKYPHNMYDAGYETKAAVKGVDLGRDIALLKPNHASGEGMPICAAAVGDVVDIYSIRSNSRKRVARATITDAWDYAMYAAGYVANHGDSGSPVVLHGKRCLAGVVLANTTRGLKMGRLVVP